MKPFAHILGAFLDPQSRYSNRDLTLAQFKANTRQMPLLYFCLVVNVWALVAAAFETSPKVLTLYLPIALSIVAAVRSFKWWRARGIVPDMQSAQAMLRRTQVLVLVLGVSVSAWSIALFAYGDAYAQGHVVSFLGLTVVTCIFCLAHLRAAALAITLLGTLAVAILIALSGDMVFAIKGLNMLLVSAAMLGFVWLNYADFESLIVSKRVLTIQQKALELRQKQTQKLSDENFRLANLDSLTDLPNRRSFFSKLETLLGSQSFETTSVVLGVLDLDGFKAINDVYGHAVGDSLLQDVAERLRSAVNENVFLSRLGGDEFGIVITNEDCDDVLQAFGDTICEALSAPFKHEETSFKIGGSLGLARCPAGGTTPSQLYELADYALFEVKKDRRGHAIIFSSEHQAAIRRSKLIERGFYEPGFVEKVTVHFQPVMDVKSNRCIAFEALARWEHPLLGRIPPDEFILIAERCGFVGRLTEILFEKALAQASRWPEHIQLSFNLSAKNVTSLQFAGQLLQLIRSSGFDPQRIDFEITETAIIQDFNQVHSVLKALKAIGVRISLDDFGTGFSSLKHLHSFPLDKIKIDRSFVSNINTGSPGYRIVKSLLNLSYEMGIDCIVEGVETAEELEVLKSLGGLYVQGYYYSPPLPGDKLAEFLTLHGGTTSAIAS